MDQYDFDTQHGGDATQSAATSFPPLVRPTPSYPHAYTTTTLGPGSNGSDGRSSQTAFYDQGDLAFGPSIMSAWGGDATTTTATNPGAGPGAFDPQTGPNYDYGHAADRAIEESVYGHQQIQQHQQQYHLDDRASNNVLPFPLASRLSHIPVSSSSPNLFGNHHQHLHQVPGISFPINSSQPSSTSASPASTNSRHGYSLDSRPGAAAAHTTTTTSSASTAAVAPFNTSPVSSASALNNEPADAPWNLVPYSLPFASGRGNAVPGAASGPAEGTSPGGAPLFLRSPTPTKRQRTSQACEKCRDRKAKRGLPCEYAKERRLRGPNRTGNGHTTGGGNGPMTEGVRQRIASSPARTSVANLAIPVHISGGQGLAPPGTTSGGISNPANMRGTSPPPGVAHHRKQLSTRLSPSPKASGTPPVPVYRTLHVAQSHPDLAYYSRPRSQTTPYPLAVNIPTHPSPLYQTMKSGTRTDLSASDMSEPPSATSSNFGSDLVTAASFGRVVDVKGEPFPLSTSMRGDGMPLGQPIGVLGLSHGESDDTLHLAAPHLVTIKHEAPDNVFINAANASPESYPSMDIGDDSQGGPNASVWQDRFAINANASGLLGRGGLSAVSTGSASASSNPSTSSPGPTGYRSHASAHSGGSIQETMGWNYRPTDQSYRTMPSPVHNGAQMAVDQPSVNFVTTSPKSDSVSFNASSSMGGIHSHVNYPWTVDHHHHNIDPSAAYPRISAPDQSGILSPSENDFRNWIDVDGNQNRTTTAAADGSPLQAASNSVRNVAVLEVRD
ncbi:hypothetical protein FRC01_005233 [Tulasnella sp. 417]|nr:hypothetical protein FRC01_005233 [Tulasnella sp. 417]